VLEKVEERWQVLCHSVMDEGDPRRLLELVQELNRELEILDRHPNDERARTASLNLSLCSVTELFP
jgi:hypothetical protein